MLKIEKIRKLSDGSFMVGLADIVSGYALLTLRLTEDNIRELYNAVAPGEPTPMETEGAVIVRGDRLDTLWCKLGTFISTQRYSVLRAWALDHIKYKFYDRKQKHPVDLCEYVCDHLRDLDEERLTELEAILG